MSNQAPKPNGLIVKDAMLDAVESRAQVGRYWREIFALAWTETELLTWRKMLTTVGISAAAFLLQWELGVRSFYVTLQIIGTVIAAYLCVALMGFVWKLLLAPAERDGKIQIENQELSERLRPRLNIIFKPDEAPFKQVYPGRDDLPLTQYRVCVVSPRAVPDVELVVNKLIVDGVDLSGAHLRPRHERDSKRGGTKRVALKPFKEDAWDVFSAHPSGVVLNTIAALGFIILSPGKYKFELMATGGDNPPATKIAILEIHADNSVVFNIREGKLSEQLI